MSQSDLKANVWKLYALKAVRSFMLVMPIIVLFYNQNGLSMRQVFALQALFSVALIGLEVPTGYFSDYFGRKRSIILGCMIGTVGNAVYSLSSSFLGFLAAEILLGVGLSFVSGSDSALMYETMLGLSSQNSYRKNEGRSSGVGMLSESMASIAGGLLAVYSLRLPFVADAIVSVLAIPIAFSLYEPPRKIMEKKQSAVMDMIKLVKYTLHDHAEIKWLAIYSSFVGASTLTMVWMIQSYWKAVQIPVSMFGILWASLMFFAAVVSWNVHPIEGYLGRKKSLAVLSILPAAGYFILGYANALWAVPAMLLFYFVRGINNPVIADYINCKVSSDIRATVLSVKNLLGRLIFSIIGPIAGWIFDMYSLQWSLIGSGAVFLLAGAVSLLFLRKHQAL